MTKLHEILAVEGDLEGTARKLVDEAQTTFAKKPDHFLEHHRTLTMFDEARGGENDEEHKAMVTTVHDKLDYVLGAVKKYYDAFAAKEATNQTAVADLVVDGEVLLKSIPATVFLGLESKLKQLRILYDAIPTLQPGLDWEKDSERGEDIYRTKGLDTRLRTEKQVKHKILYEATDKHPAQIEKWTADFPVGRIETRHWSGMFSPAEKSRLLGRIDKLIRGVKRARQRANEAELVQLRVGQVLEDYING